MTKNIKLYHLTPESNLNKILEEGLLPHKSKSSLQAVFLTNDISVAENYKSMYDEKCVILSVNLVELDPDKLGPDNYELKDFLEQQKSKIYWSDCDWEFSLKKVNQVAYYGKIESNLIEVVS